MSLRIYMDGLDLYTPWSGATYAYDLIDNAGKLPELELWLEREYPDGLSETELNDLLWFEDEMILEALGVSEEEEEDD